MVQPAYTTPIELEDKVMEQVTAGNTNEGGGLIVGKSSKSLINSSSEINLSSEAQRGSKGLNISNSAESAVANTINIWDGKSVNISVESDNVKPVLEVNQVNNITQNKIHTATVSGYLRKEADQTEIFNRFNSENYSSTIINSNNTIALKEENTKSFSASSAAVNTLTKFNIGDKFYFEGNLGQGIAIAGHTDITYDGGSADIVLMVGGGISVPPMGPGSDEGDFHAFGLNFGDTEASVGIDVSANLSLVTRLVFPKMNIVIDGAGCGVVMGSCNASSITKEYTSTKSDNSTHDIVENHQSGQSVFSEYYENIYRSPFKLESAKAEYIIVDDSSLEYNSDVLLELSDSAQKEIEGINIVNAIGSNVANSTNISRASEFKSRRSTLVLNQFNIVHHGQ